MIISRSIHVAANGIISFFFIVSNSPLYIYTSHLLYPFICWWTLRLLLCLGYCSPSMNTGMHVSFQIRVLSFPDICPGVGLLVHMVTLYLVFKGTSKLFSIVAAAIYILINSVRIFPFILSKIKRLCFLQIVSFQKTAVFSFSWQCLSQRRSF